MSGPDIAGWARQRRAELGYTRADVVLEAARAGHKISQSTVQAIEDGQRTSLQPRVVDALAAGLQVDAGTVRAVLNGEPAQPPPSDDASVAGMLDWLTDAQRRTVLTAVRRWANQHPDYAPLLGSGGGCDTLTAIDTDPALSDENRTMLTVMYQTMTERSDHDVAVP